MRLYSNRAGKIIPVNSGYSCYVPRSLGDISIEFDQELMDLLVESNVLLNKLDMLSSILPNKDTLIAKYVEKEAVISSQIEGTQSSLSDVFQISSLKGEARKEVEDVVNYVYTLNYGIKLLDQLPISIRYLKLLHKELLRGVRGNDKNPGELRKSQNWIGPMGATLLNASYVPPSPDLMLDCLYDLEKYINNDSPVSDLVKIALIHYQFETIHPFLDGNGRLGRILIPIYLKSKKILNNPMLYLSLYFKQNRTDYYSLLNDVRFKGKYEEWVMFFLRGIITMSMSSINTIERINSLYTNIINKIEAGKFKNKKLIKNAIDLLFKFPYINSSDVIKYLKVTKPTASALIKKLTEFGLVTPTSSKQRRITYRFNDYADILEDGTEITK